MADTPPEAEIVDDLALGTDLKPKVDQAWRDFAKALAAAVPQLTPGTQLDIALDPTAAGVGEAVYAVSMQRGEGDHLRLLAVGNASLPDGYHLDRSAVAGMVALGWSPPGVVDGSGEEFGMVTSPTEVAEVTRTIVRTLRDVYGAPHPAFLTYVAQDAKGAPVAAPSLATARSLMALGSAPTAGLPALTAGGADDNPTDALPLADRVATIVAAMMKTEPEALQVDKDGDIGIRSGSAMVFVRVRDNPPLVDVFSPVLTEIEATEKLYEKLSELTNRMPIGRLYCVNDTVWASIPVFGRDFQATHLMLAVQVMTGLADELDDRLHGEFGGKRFFGEGDSPALKEGTERTGMYL
jgi:hypothetical protein